MSGSTESDPDSTGEGVGLFPVEDKWFSVLFYGALLVWALLLMYWSLDWRWDNKLFPLAVGSIAILLLAIHLASLLFPAFFDRFTPVSEPEATDDEDDEFKNRIQEATSSTSGRPKAEREKYELWMLGWVLVLPVLLYLAGFGLVIPIYTFAFSWFFLRDLKMAIVTAVFITLFIWLLFVVLLDVQLWGGTLGLVNPLDYIPQPF